MKIKFWGVRGSIPVPGPKTARYGGNTTCIEVRTDNDTLLILDGGTGTDTMGGMTTANPERSADDGFLAELGMRPMGTREEVLVGLHP